MYDDFIDNGNQVSYELYRKLFDQQNIGFGATSTDECEQCLRYERHKAQVSESEHSPEECSICSEAKIHIDKASEARKLYREDIIRPNCYSVDMQKVLIIPKLTTKESFFTSRLVCFNETFASGSEGGKDYTIMWNEAVSGRKAADVASSYTKFFTETGEKTPIFWADNCAGQNKNWTLYTAFVTLVNCEWGPDEITVKYFEPGHSFMKADTVHGLIGKKLKRTPEVITFKDLTNLVSNSSSRIELVEMQCDDFYKFVQGNRTRNTQNIKMPRLCELVEVKFVRGSKLLFYKQRHTSEEYTGVEFLRVKFQIEPVPGRAEVSRGISSKKKAGILEILQHVQPLQRKFYSDLRTNDASLDLVSRFDL